MALTRPVLMMSSSARTIPVHSTGSVSTPCAQVTKQKQGIPWHHIRKHGTCASIQTAPGGNHVAIMRRRIRFRWFD
jgi:hypothetical protein